VAELGTTLDEARGVIADLQGKGWLDEHTRAVFVEFNLYNPNLNMWGISLMLAECLQTGRMYQSEVG
jgi:hypothetical protein